jgi:hypothetical protein
LSGVTRCNIKRTFDEEELGLPYLNKPNSSLNFVLTEKALQEGYQEETKFILIDIWRELGHLSYLYTNYKNYVNNVSFFVLYPYLFVDWHFFLFLWI